MANQKYMDQLNYKIGGEKDQADNPEDKMR